ncbi:TetR/AcrR family transcriptional regulator [Streptomyces sp. BH097]|uniref:TetR/AcrR family transcriptional regulator n=1 Tax=unclassified Streptomyces TaxID=2593676 RepID=UPI003BB5D340
MSSPREERVESTEGQVGGAGRGKRADAARNQEKLLAAAAQVFVTSGVDAPVRRIAAEAGVGMGTIYRHFPTRAELVVAVFRHQVEECAEAGPRLLAEAGSPFEALRAWVDLFVDFLVTKHGLANTLEPESSGFAALHSYFIDRLMPVAADLLDAAVEAGEIRPGTRPYEFLRGIGNLCIGHESDTDYDPRRLIDLLLRGLRQPR